MPGNPCHLVATHLESLLPRSTETIVSSSFACGSAFDKKTVTQRAQVKLGLQLQLNSLPSVIFLHHSLT
jgi:hypothetical protein